MKTAEQTLLEEAYSVVETKRIIDNYITFGNIGNLNLERANGVSFPDNFVVNGNLQMRYAKIKHFPDNMTVNGTVDAEGLTFKALPKNLKVKRTLDLRSSSLTVIPDNLTIGEDLIIGYTNIAVLPKNLKIGGALFMPSTDIQLKDIKYYVDVKGKVHSSHFSNEEFKEHNERLNKYKELKKKLPEIEGIF